MAESRGRSIAQGFGSVLGGIGEALEGFGATAGGRGEDYRRGKLMEREQQLKEEERARLIQESESAKSGAVEAAKVRDIIRMGKSGETDRVMSTIFQNAREEGSAQHWNTLAQMAFTQGEEAFPAIEGLLGQLDAAAQGAGYIDAPEEYNLARGAIRQNEYGEVVGKGAPFPEAAAAKEQFIPESYNEVAGTIGVMRNGKAMTISLADHVAPAAENEDIKIIAGSFDDVQGTVSVIQNGQPVTLKIEGFIAGETDGEKPQIIGGSYDGVNGTVGVIQNGQAQTLNLSDFVAQDQPVSDWRIVAGTFNEADGSYVERNQRTNEPRQVTTPDYIAPEPDPTSRAKTRGPDGYMYYDDDETRVLPNVVRPLTQTEQKFQYLTSIGVAPEDAQRKALGFETIMADPAGGRVWLVNETDGQVEEIVIKRETPDRAVIPEENTIWNAINLGTGIESGVKAALAEGAGIFGVDAYGDTIEDRTILSLGANPLIESLALTSRLGSIEIERIKEMVNLSPALLQQEAPMRRRAHTIDRVLRSHMAQAMVDAQNQNLPQAETDKAASDAAAIGRYLDLLGVPTEPTQSMFTREGVLEMPVYDLKRFSQNPANADFIRNMDDEVYGIYRERLGGR